MTPTSTNRSSGNQIPKFYFIFLFLFTILCTGMMQAQSLQLTAGTQWVNLGDLDVPGNQITVEALINWQGGVNVVSKHTGPNNVNYLLRPTTFEITTGSTFHLMSNPYTLQNGTWYHIAGVYDGSLITYYVNGCPVIQQAATGNMAQQNLSTAIGNISSSPYGEQFIGMIDEVRIWNIARTQAQIAANMNDLPNPTTYPNLLAYYKFSNNLLNSANASWNGTAVGPISYAAEPPLIAQLSIVSVVPTNSTCYGAHNGSVTITASGSGVQYSVDGTNYQAGSTITGLGPGNYTAYIRSSEGCVLSQAFSITEPAQLISTFTASICSGDSYPFAGTNYTSTGTYTVVNPGSTGCDSTSTLNLTVVNASGPPPPASHFNTGTNGAGGTLAGGSPDASWDVAIGNINGPYSSAFVMLTGSIPGSYYNSPWPDCGWISHNAQGTDNGSNVTYFYQTQFNLPCFSSCGQSYADDGVFCLSLDFFADNSVYEIYVNGVPQSSNIPGMPVANPYNYIGFQQAGMVSVSLCNDWQPGTNTLIIEIRSGGGSAGFLAQTAINPPPVFSDTVSAQICSGQNYAFGGNSYNSTGQYTVTFQTINGCDSLVTLDLLVKPTPAQPVISSNSPVCEGGNIQLNTAAVSSATYAWSGPNTFTSTVQNPSLAPATLPMAGTYNLAITVNGCTSPSGSSAVVVNPLPAAPTVGINSPLCEGETLSLTGTGATGSQYHWSGPNIWTSTTQNPQLNNVVTTQSGNYSLYVVLSGCTSATTTQAAIVNPKPQVSYNGALSFCGTEALLSATGMVQAPSSIVAYNWYSTGVGAIGSGTPNVYDFTGANPTVSADVLVVAQTAESCSDSATVQLTLYATPNAHFAWIDLCNGANIQFTDESNWNGNPQGGNTFTHNWSFGDTQTGSATSPNHAYSDTGSYTVTLVTGSTESVCSDTLVQQITVHPDIQIDLTIQPDACGQGVSFSANLDPQGAASSLLWDLGDGATAADSSFKHTYAEAGQYNIQLTVNTDYNCTFTAGDLVQVLPVPTIGTVELPNIITPNGDAVNDALTLDALFADCVEYELKIMNRWGNLIYTQHKGSEPFSGKGMFNTLVSPGVYFFVITSSDESKTGTITVSY